MKIEELWNRFKKWLGSLLLQRKQTRFVTFRVVTGGKIADRLWVFLEELGAITQEPWKPEVVFLFRRDRPWFPPWDGLSSVGYSIPDRRWPGARRIFVTIETTRQEGETALVARQVDETLDLDGNPQIVREALERILTVID